VKVYISFKITDKPAGGGNNFLKYLALSLEQRNLLTQKIRDADILLINSHHNIIKNMLIKFFFKEKIFVHRVDGKLSLHRTSKRWDNLVELQNLIIANATIFQSNWSKQIWAKTLNSMNYRIILNQADSKIFKVAQPKRLSKPFTLAYLSFSQNKNKGGNLIKWLEKEQNNFNIELNTIGSEITDKDKLKSDKVSQQTIARKLSECHALIYPSLNDACSNVILEALAMGLPVIALNSGGNPEIVGNAGVLFSDKNEIQKAIKEIQKNYFQYSRNALKITSNLNSIEKYLEYFKELTVTQKYENNVSRLKILKTALKVIKIHFALKLSRLK
jgi:glycosyltransferase involved in cell wall biosynthesis